jgi:hypothetical protein
MGGSVQIEIGKMEEESLFFASSVVIVYHKGTEEHKDFIRNLKIATRLSTRQVDISGTL